MTRSGENVEKDFNEVNYFQRLAEVKGLTRVEKPSGTSKNGTHYNSGQKGSGGESHAT